MCVYFGLTNTYLLLKEADDALNNVYRPSHSRTNSLESYIHIINSGTTSPCSSLRSSPTTQSNLTSPVQLGFVTVTSKIHLEGDCFDYSDKENDHDLKNVFIDTCNLSYCSSKEYVPKNDWFIYKTFDGQVVQSVMAPGFGKKVAYKVRKSVFKVLIY